MERHRGRLHEGDLWARVAPVVDRESLRSASLFSRTSCTALGFPRDSVSGAGAARADNSLVVVFAEFEERNRRFFRRNGRMSLAQSEGLTSNRAMLGWDVGG